MRRERRTLIGSTVCGRTVAVWQPALLSVVVTSHSRSYARLHVDVRLVDNVAQPKWRCILKSQLQIQI